MAAGKRRYQLLWEELKREGFASIEIPRETHQRVIDALTKESSMDQGFRFKCIERDVSYTVENSQLGDLIQFSICYKSTMPPTFVVGPQQYASQTKSYSKYETRHLTVEEKAQLDAACPPPSKS